MFSNLNVLCNLSFAHILCHAIFNEMFWCMSAIDFLIYAHRLDDNFMIVEKANCRNFCTFRFGGLHVF